MLRVTSETLLPTVALAMMVSSAASLMVRVPTLVLMARLETLAASFTAVSAYSFMCFNLLCAPCFAAMGAIKREMNNGKWTAIAIGYMCLLAYCTSLVVYQIGGLFTGEVTFGLGSVVAFAVLAFALYLLVRPNKYDETHVRLDTRKLVNSK